MTQSRAFALYTILATLTVTSAAGCTEQPDTKATRQGSYVAEYGLVTLAAGNNNNWSDTVCTGASDLCRLVGDVSGSTITGLDEAAFGNRFYGVWLYNEGLYSIHFAHNSSSSSTANRLRLRAGADLTLAPGYGVWLVTITDWSTDPITPLGWTEIGAHAVEDAVASTPSRTLGTAFRPSTDRPTLVTFSANAECSISLSGGQEGRVELLSDSANPPTTIRAELAGCKNTGTVVLGVSEVVGSRGTATYWVPTGDYVLVRGVNVTSTPTLVITHQTEQRL